MATERAGIGRCVARLAVAAVGLALLGAPLSVSAKKKPETAEPLEPPMALPENGVLLLSVAEPLYGSWADPAALRSGPDSFTRLVVFRDGHPVLDRGLEDETKATTQRDVEEGILEQATVATDGRVAVIVGSRFLRTRAKETDEEFIQGDTILKGTTEITWIDPAHPTGRWTKPLEPKRWVREMVPLSMALGVALSTFTTNENVADFRLLDPDGGVLHHIPETEATSGAMTLTQNGAFLAVELAYPQRQGQPDRGLVIFDLLRGTRWTYSWSYGSEREPLSWSLEESGILAVRAAGGTEHYDRMGSPLKSTRHR